MTLFRLSYRGYGSHYTTVAETQEQAWAQIKAHLLTPSQPANQWSDEHNRGQVRDIEEHADQWEWQPFALTHVIEGEWS